MKPSHYLALGLACLFLTSCLVTSDNPLTAPETAKPDLRLVGDWINKDDDDNDGEITRFSVKKGGWMHVDILSRKPGDKAESYDFFPSVIGKETFLNVVMVSKDENGQVTKGFIFLRYTIRNDRLLQMWMLSEDEVEDAIDAGKIKGKVHEDKNWTLIGNTSHPDVDITLRDSSANLVKFLQKSNLKKLFSEKAQPLVRVKPPTKQGK